MAELTTHYDNRLYATPPRGPNNVTPEEILRKAFMTALELEQVKRSKQVAALVASKEANTAEAEAAENWQRFEAELTAYLGKKDIAR